MDGMVNGVVTGRDRRPTADQVATSFVKRPLQVDSGFNGKDIRAALDEQSKADFLEELRMYGGGVLPQQIFVELKACSQIGRIPGGLPSSNVMADTILGRDEVITFSDYLNRYEFDEDMTTGIKR